MERKGKRYAHDVEEGGGSASKVWRRTVLDLLGQNEVSYRTAQSIINASSAAGAGGLEDAVRTKIFI